MPWLPSTHDNSKTMLKLCISMRPLIWDITWLYTLRNDDFFFTKYIFYGNTLMDTHSNDFLTFLINQACPKTFISHLGRHLEFLKTLNDASWARFWKYMTSCTQISHNLFGFFFCKVFKLAAGLYLKPPNSLNCTVTCTIHISQINFFSLFDNFDIHVTFDLGLVWRSIPMVWLTWKRFYFLEYKI